MSWQHDYLERFYRRHPNWQDGTQQFHGLCRAHIRPGARILEIGAGPSNPTSRFLSGLGEVWGVDLDGEVFGNEFLKKAALLERDRIPFDDGSFDAAVSNYVAEHVADPVAHLSEVARVLKRGSPYLVRTPNRWHYVALVASLTPHWFHQLVANRARNQVGAHEPYPTVYAMNSERTLRRQAAATGFAIESLDWVEKEPSYAMASRLMFLAGLAYERAVNLSKFTRGMRSNLFVVLRRI